MKTSHKTLLVAASIALLTSSAIAQIATAQTPPANAENVISMLAPIKSAKDLERYLKMTPLKASPLSYLSASAKTEFLGSLKFNENGVTSFKYSGLEAELTPSKIAEVFSLFGIQRTVPLLSKAKIETARDRQILGGNVTPACDVTDPLRVGATPLCGDIDGNWGGGTPGGGAGGGFGGSVPTPPAPGPIPTPTPQPGDYANYECANKGTCKPAMRYICTKSC